MKCDPNVSALFRIFWLLPSLWLSACYSSHYGAIYLIISYILLLAVQYVQCGLLTPPGWGSIFILETLSSSSRSATADQSWPLPRPVPGQWRLEPKPVSSWSGFITKLATWWVLLLLVAAMLGKVSHLPAILSGPDCICGRCILPKVKWNLFKR